MPYNQHRIFHSEASRYPHLSSRRTVLSVGSAIVTGLAARYISALPLAKSHLTVLAASDLSGVWPHLMRSFEKLNTGASVRVSFGSSGNFLRQIRQGLAYDVFLTADYSHIQQLVDEGRAIAPSKPWIKGGLALSYQLPAPVKAEGAALTPSAVKRVLERVRWLAIANPHHAPYGKAAQQALQSWGLWNDLQARLVIADSAAQATQFLFQGGAQAALVPGSLVINPGAKGQNDWQIQQGALTFAVQRVTDQSHQPILQGIALSSSSNRITHELVEYLRSPVALAILEDHGFERVKES